MRWKVEYCTSVLECHIDKLVMNLENKSFHNKKKAKGTCTFVSVKCMGKSDYCGAHQTVCQFSISSDKIFSKKTVNKKSVRFWGEQIKEQKIFT